GRDGRVERDVQAPQRRRDDLTAAGGGGERLQNRGWRREVAVYARLPGQDLPTCHRRVGVALLEHDPVQIRGAVDGPRVPAGVANELDQSPGLVAPEHVRAGGDVVATIVGRFPAVVAGGVLAGHRRGAR